VGMGKKNLLGLAALSLVVALYAAVLWDSYLMSVMTFAGIHGLIVLGLSLLFGYAGQISLGHAAFFGLGAYASGVLTVKYGFSPWPTIALAVVFTCVVAFIIGLPTLKLRGHYLAMATLGFGEIVYIVFNEQGELTGGPSGLVGIPLLELGGITFDDDRSFFCLVWICVLAALALSLNLVNSRVGRALKAVHGNDMAAQSLGVDASLYKLQVFIISAALAALAGSLYAHYLTFISPSSFNLMFSIRLVMMVVIGGMGSLWGALSGAVLLTFLPEYLTDYFEDWVFLVIYGGLMVAIMIFMPQGLALGLVRAASWVWRRSAPVLVVERLDRFFAEESDVVPGDDLLLPGTPKSLPAPSGTKLPRPDDHS